MIIGFRQEWGICWGKRQLALFKKESVLCYWLGKGKGTGKVIPLQAWTGHTGSRRLRLPDFKTIGT